MIGGYPVYAQFLGYEKGEDGLPRIVPEEAETVRLIYRLFMEGKTPSAIAKRLTRQGVPTPAGKDKWQACGVQSILQNEKYKGHALMQKTFCANFLTKEMVKNTGQVQQYYVEDSHPAIVAPDEWDAVQAETRRRKSLGSIGRCGNPFSGKIICGECGGYFGKKVWGSYKGDKTYRREVYQCNEKYKHKGKGGRQCGTPFVTEGEVKAHFLTAFNMLMTDRDGLITDCRLAQSAISDTSAIETELAELLREIEVITELSRKAIYENARNAQNQSDFKERNDGYLERHRKATERIAELEAEKRERIAKGITLDRFITDIEKRPRVFTEWDEALWLAVVDKATVATDGTMTFTFRNGSQITARHL